LTELTRIKAEHNLSGSAELLFTKVKLNSKALQDIDNLISVLASDIESI
jgi:hypothetical protein